VIVLGIDPGSVRTGFGVIEWRSDQVGVVLDRGIVRPSGAHVEKLGQIYDGITRVIEKYRPALGTCAIEMPVYAKNAQAMLKLGRAQAAAMLAAHNQGLVVHQYTPKSIKLSVTGNGAAGKEQVAYMVRSLLGMREDVCTMDGSDALAVALCHCHHQLQPHQEHGDWSTFARENPGRIQ